MTLPAGTRLGNYEIVAQIGAGGMGEVYRAKDPKLAREVAIKVLPEDFFEGEERRLRFEREAKLLASLNHPNIAAIYSFEEIPGSSSVLDPGLLVMELLDGESLRDRLRAGPCRRRRPSSSRRSWPKAWRPRTRAGSFIATSSRKTSSSRRTAA